ncbi:MAG: YraN family protein [Bacteroidota bacterium]
MSEHIELGKNGEEVACGYLREKGFIIIKKNWKLGANEVDIIARHGDYIVFVEVKTRTSAWFGEPEMSVTKQKQKTLIRCANAYMQMNNIDKEARFDILSIVVSSGKTSINHIENGFFPTL